MSRKTVLTAISFVAALIANPTRANELTIDGFILSGSSLGLIYDSKHEYSYGGTTRNLAILNKGCPVRMGEVTLCK